jgi:hypothetical protein
VSNPTISHTINDPFLPLIRSRMWRKRRSSMFQSPSDRQLFKHRVTLRDPLDDHLPCALRDRIRRVSESCSDRQPLTRCGRVTFNSNVPFLTITFALRFRDIKAVKPPELTLSRVNRPSPPHRLAVRCIIIFSAADWRLAWAAV